MADKVSSRSQLNLVGTAGEYFVCAELCRIGFLALLTPKNNPLFDVVVTSDDGRISVPIQVKTRSIHNKLGWKLGAKFCEVDFPSNMLVALVNLTDTAAPDFYIYRYSELAERVNTVYKNYMNVPKRDGTQRKEVAFRWFDEVNFTDVDRARKNNWTPVLQALQSSHE